MVTNDRSTTATTATTAATAATAASTTTPTRAIVRGVAATFANALAAERPQSPIDVGRARAQHHAYVEALASLGIETVVLPPDDRCPDCCFVEDTCVIVGELALLTRPGAISRRPEVEAVGAAVGQFCRVVRMEGEATLDGGDCMLLGKTFYVGRSTRTNDAGIARLREVAATVGYDVVAVAVPTGVLHLKSVCSALTDELVLVVEGTLEGTLEGTRKATTFDRVRVLVTPSSEAHGVNVVRVNDAALVSADAPLTRALVERAGIRVVPVDASELRKADGALTCLSILF